MAPAEFARMEHITHHLLNSLKGHVCAISDIQISHIGDRVLTASAEECTARVWSFNKDYTKSVHIVLPLCGAVDGIDALLGNSATISSSSSAGNTLSGNKIQQRVRGRNATASRQVIKSELYSVCWTANDVRIITLQSVPGWSAAGAVGGVRGCGLNSSSAAAAAAENTPTRLKVWDALTGDLLRVIVSVSDAPARVLATHPIDVNIVVSIGQVPQHIIVCGMPRSCRAIEIEYVPVHFCC
jgi:WD40 repeat protein